MVCRANVVLAVGSAAADFMIWAAVFAAIVIGAGCFLGWYRRRLRRSMSGSSGRFTLDDLRGMRDRGELTASEYERLRAVAIADLGVTQSLDA